MNHVIETVLSSAYNKMFWLRNEKKITLVSGGLIHVCVRLLGQLCYGALFSRCSDFLKKVSLIRKCNNHKPQINYD